VGAFEATFAPNPVVMDSGRTFEGLEAIRGWSERELLGAGGQITIACAEAAPAGITLNVRYASQVYNGPGRYVFTLTGDQIQRVDMVPPVADACPAADGEAAAASGAPIAATSGDQVGGTDGVPPAAQCYVDAVNAENLDALVECFAPDGLVIDVSRRFEGAEAVRRWADNEVIGGSLRVLEVAEHHEGSVRLLVHWAPAGSQGWQAYYTFDYADGRITTADLQYA
jgi:hypothetical protein